VTGFPVVDDAGRMAGIATKRDMRFACADDTPVRVMMTAENLAILQEPTDREALLTDGVGKLTGLLTLKDTEQTVLNPTACKDRLGRLPRRWAMPGSSGSKLWWVPGLI